MPVIRWFSTLFVLLVFPLNLLAEPPRGKDVATAPAAVLQAGAPDDAKIDPLLRMTLDRVSRRWSGMQPLSTEIPLRSLPVVLEQDGPSEPLAHVFVRTDDVEATLRAIDDAGGRHSTVVAGIVVAALPLSAVRAFAARSETRFIEGSRWMEPTLDLSRAEIHADKVQAGTGLAQPYDGTGVIVGVLDTGIDWNHSDFKDSSGKSRIEYLWDMSREGRAPTGFNHGYEYTKADIDAGLCQEVDGNGGGGHGTHTSGTAAGNGARSSGKYVGIAPKAGIIFAKGIRQADSGGSFSGTDITDGISYLFQKGASLGKPVSVNMSIGGHAYAHDGNSAYEQTLQGLTGPGKILSVSAGNDGARPIHLGYQTTGTAYLSGISTELVPSSATYAGVILIAPSGVSVGLKSKTNNLFTSSCGTTTTTYCNGIGPVTPGNSTPLTTMSCSGKTIGYAQIDGTTTSGGLTTYYIEVSNNSDSSIDISKAGWELYTFGSGRVDAWFYSGGKFSTCSDPANGWLPGDTSMTIGVPATANGLIGVAAYITKTSWTTIDGGSQSPSSWCYSTPDIFLDQIACFSSHGPTRDGRQKPDIAAPGMFIVAPLSSTLDVSSSSLRPYIVSGGSYRVDQGTSMAAPHVTGVVALMLQAKPTLTPAQALQAMQQSARHDSYTGSGTNLIWGAGKVDALAAVQAVAPAPSPDFALSVSPASLSVTAGAGASSQVTTSVSGGFSGSISLSATGLPSGASASFSPATIGAPGSGSSTMSISTSSSTPAGSYTVTVTGNGGGKSHSATLSLTVTSGSSGGATSVKIVPIVLDVAGVGSSRYSTELTLSNRGSTNATVQLLYTAATSISGAGSGTVSTTLGAGRQTVISDTIAYLRSHGLAIPSDGSGQGGTLRVTFTGLSSSDVAFAGARTTTPSGTGRAGLSYPGVSPSDCFTDKAWLYGLRQNGSDRTNLALVNASTTSSVTLRVNVWNADMSVGYYLTPDTTLGPGQWAQIGKILDLVGFSAGSARVDLLSGSGPFYVYGVFNDNTTNDGSYVVPLPNTYTLETVTLPVLVETSTFSSELVLKNYTSSYASISLNYVESLSPSAGAGGTATDTLAPFEQRIVPNAIQYLRSRGIGLSPSGTASFAGALRVTFNVSGSLNGGFVGARTGSPAPGGGQYGLFYSGMGPSTAAASEAWVFGLQENSSIRSNLAIVNLGDAGSITFRIDVFNGDTGQQVGSSINYTLVAGGWIQFSAVLPTFGATNGFARVVKVSGSSQFLSYGVVNDGATPSSGATNDGSFIGFANR
jgi:subtilisin family serine protease